MEDKFRVIIKGDMQRLTPSEQKAVLDSAILLHKAFGDRRVCVTNFFFPSSEGVAEAMRGYQPTPTEGEPEQLPDPYSGAFNEARIKAYRLLADSFNVQEGTVRDIFSAGIGWYIGNCSKYASLNK